MEPEMGSRMGAYVLHLSASSHFLSTLYRIIRASNQIPLLKIGGHLHIVQIFLQQARLPFGDFCWA